MKKINFKGLAAIGFSEIIGTSATALFWFFLASVIPPEQYGEIFFYLGIASIVSAIVLFGNKNTIIVYISKNIQLQNTLYVINIAGELEFLEDTFQHLGVQSHQAVVKSDIGVLFAN